MGTSLRRLTALSGMTAVLLSASPGSLAQSIDRAGGAEVAAVQSLAPVASMVTGIRVGKHPGKTRVVIDVSQPTDVRYDVSADGTAVFIELPTVNWSAQPFSARHAKGQVVDYTFSKDGAGGRLSILSSGPVRINKPFFVSPDGTRGHRIVIDILPTTISEPGHGNFRQASTFTPVSLKTNQPGGVMVASTANIGAPAGDPSLEPEPIVAVRAEEELELAQMRAPNNQPMQQPAPMAPQQQMQPQMQPQLAPQQMQPHQQPSILGFQNIYLKAGLGVGMVPELTSTGSGNENTMEFDPGFLFNGGLGIDLENGFRIEGEMNYAFNSLGKVTGTGNGNSFGTTFTDGDITILSFMANLAYDFPEQNGFTPFIMGGLGLTGIFVNDLTADSTVIADSSDWVFGMQAGGGISYKLDELTTLEALYRYFETQDPEFGDQRGIPYESEYFSHSFILGARLKF